MLAPSVRYVTARTGLGCNLDAGTLFEAMVPDLVHDGNVDLAMQKAFRWGFEDDQGEHVPGLQDISRRLREEREAMEAGGDGETREGPPPDAEFPDSEPSEKAEGDDSAQVRSGQLETLERSLRQVEDFDDLSNLDPDLVDTLLTDEEQDWIEQWIQMEGLLKGEGYVIEVGDRLELTPRAVRRIGERVLRELFTQVKGSSTGVHDARKRSRVGPAIETSSPWEYGDPFSLHLTRTVMNSLRRQGPGASLALLPEDFEIYDREALGASATVLLIDMSRSMFYNGCWDAAKRSALALDTLIRTSYERDDLEIVGFSERAERLTLTQLPALAWNEYSHGTNLQDGLRLARELLRSHRSKTRQVVLITDGEPTAWLDEGEVRFEHPATDRVYDATLREVGRCTREGIVINVVLMGNDPQMAAFAERMTRMNRGRLIHADAGNLGAFVLRDFVEHRTKRL